MLDPNRKYTTAGWSSQAISRQGALSREALLIIAIAVVVVIIVVAVKA